MKKTVLGELEELVLLVVAASTEEAYGVPICEQLQQQTGRSFTIGAVHGDFSETDHLISETADH